jgi:carboxyl-terminal processing protease
MLKKFKYPLIGLVVLLTLLATAPTDRYFEIVKNLDIFATAYKEVNTYYVDEVNPSKLMRTGIESMLGSLDPYTNYIPEDDIEDYRTQATGEYAGIGALVDRKNGIPTITMPYEGFAAERAGLKIGDEIVAINGTNVTSISYEQADQMMKGQAGTDVKLTIRRHGQKETFDVRLKREKITLKNVPYYGMVTENIGYMRLTDFTTKAGNEVRAALLDLKKQGATNIILDLRGNPGGLLEEAVNICNVFVPQGKEVVTTRGKVAEWTHLYQTLNPPTDTEIPLAVLIDRGSASASEIVSGVMQDYDRGVLIGRKTFGKGLVQQTRPLAYNSRIKVTTAKYYIPSGRCIQALDYSNRNADGSVGAVADSLKSAFKTKNERVVYDGGGVDPDVLRPAIDYAPVTMSLLQNDLIFQYATAYYYSRDKIADPRVFRLTDAEYADFLNWLKSKKFSYQTELEKQLDKMKKIAESDRQKEMVQPAVIALEKKITESKAKDLQTYEKEIRMLLEQEIASRYYLQRGIVESTFGKDPDITAAVDLLNNPARYQKILSGK